MQLTEVKFKISPGGEINMEVLNGQGSSCVEVTKEIEVSLANAGQKKDEGKKPEFYEGSGNLSVFNDLT
ncbi:DUF2997 domain-containing protein [Oceanobacillus profundus]|uniref:DUF2997 domain-containing protein n=1 Tax=Oceanobacillus profundus TaxID=372463 RepID=A0A417YGF0_9BACI|nr:DUF2997 domain-containing protein [Oceanobacillus profundus]MBR2246810.1 DUF2997 domain-containing protein [Bacilli bacterium]MBR3119746.1 DUF2997 domain-containing protein [Oceanobacillus sp.]RHW31897.1 DUF2997 domain-containing protein [Oceanobacillus profundus]